MKKRIKIENTLIFIDSEGPVSDKAIDEATRFLYQLKISNIVKDADNYLFGKELPNKLKRDLGVKA